LRRAGCVTIEIREEAEVIVDVKIKNNCTLDKEK